MIPSLAISRRSKYERGAAAPAFPVIAASAATTNLSDPAVVNLPAGIAAGNLLVAIIGPSTARSGTPPSGWNEIADEADGGGGFQFIVAYRFADGSEGSTISYDLSGTNFGGAARVLRITGAHASTPPAIATAKTSSNTPNPPSLNPAAWDVENTLWIAAAACDDADSITAVPSDYTEIAIDSDSGFDLATGYRQNAVASEDPGAFTASGSMSWVAATIGIRPA